MTCHDKKGQIFGLIIMDIFKSFDTLNHKLLLNKLPGHRFDKNHFLLLKAILLTGNKRPS